ncbi:MAG: type IV pilus twitching motility protein PilT [Firmicutes bacterium]|nr:type IV pilus twitching motility protein PilT [Bacillota bacterium]
MLIADSMLQLLEIAIDQRASDLHLSPGVPPFLRILGSLTPINGFAPLRPAHIEELARNITDPRHWQIFEQTGEVDFSYGVAGLGRFRCSLFRQRGSPAIAMRVITGSVRSIKDLGLPDVLDDLCRKRDGLVLVTGPTGSGKSTTLAAMIERINQTRRGVIITLEDPIEYLHEHKKCIVNQREIGTDTETFASGLRAALRGDPDVILVGEMRDLETIATALTAAETGHLVLSTLHTRGAAKTIDRIIDVFPPENQQQIRVQLASVLEAVVSQLLIPRLDGTGMVPAVEVMLGTPAIRNMIRDGKTHQIPSMIETGKRFGMQTMESALNDLANRGLIDPVHTIASANG